MKKVFALIACLALLAGCGHDRCCNPCDPTDDCCVEEKRGCEEVYCEECRRYHAPEPPEGYHVVE